MGKKPQADEEPKEPKLAKCRMNKHSRLKSGRTIGERREHVETASERLEAKKKIKKRQTFRVGFTVFLFIVVAGLVITAIVVFLKNRAVNEQETAPTVVVKTYKPTIEIVDENASSSGITTRMTEYIGQLESDLKDIGITPVKAVVPTGSIREVDFYLNGYNGFIKTTIDRGSGVTAEDTERMLRYLKERGINDFQYIDVRIDGKAYWK